MVAASLCVVISIGCWSRSLLVLQAHILEVFGRGVLRGLILQLVTLFEVLG